MKFCLIVVGVLIVAVFLSCNNNDKSNSNGSSASDSSVKTVDSSNRLETRDPSSVIIRGLVDAKLEARITDTLMKMSFVRETDHYLDSLTGHKHGISFIMDSVGKNEISVMAGYNGSERFETYYNFTIYPASFDISIEYPATGKLIPVEQYIKLTKDNVTR